MTDLWTQLAARADLTLTPAQLALFDRYLDLLVEANATMNLTRITDRTAAAVQHVGDALTLLPFLPTGGHTLADVGSGGGVPGLPLAVARPDARVTLIEATKKKADFLKRAAEALGLANVTVVPLRAEDAGQGDLRETFDVATARAVATLDWLAEWCLPLARKGGHVLLMKGPRHADELPAAAKAIRLLGGGDATVHRVDLPGATGHVVIDIPKVAKGDKRYPRSASVAKGNPIR